jgi:hypothetical protein
MVALSIWLAVAIVAVALLFAFKEDSLDYVIEFLLGASLVMLIWIITTV